MKYRLLLLTFVSLFICSCTRNKKSDVEYIPYQESDGGMWNMISTEGEVLFEGEFKKEQVPTVVKEGRFMVKNSEGLWNIYTAEKKPKKVGGDYVSCTLFNNGIALAAERNGYVTIIDRDGKVKKTLDKIDGKEVQEVDAFSEGYAVYLADSLYGVIDEDGDKVIDAKYVRIQPCSDGKFIAVDKKYKKDYIAGNRNKIKFSILDTKGKLLFEVNGAKEEIGSFFSDGKVEEYVKKDGEVLCGILNDKGEELVKPSERNKHIYEIRGDNFIYDNGDGKGLMNIKGETLVRAKYDALTFDTDNILLAGTKNDNKTTYKLIDTEDNQIGTDDYISIIGFSRIDNKHALVRINDKLWSIIDKDGKQLEKLPDMVHVSLEGGDYIVENDHVDCTALINDMKISQNGVGKFTFATTPKQAVNICKNDLYHGDKEHPVTDPYWYDYSTSVSYDCESQGMYIPVTLQFNGFISHHNYTVRRVIDYEGYYWTWYHNEKNYTGYSFTSAKPSLIKVEFNNIGKKRGKLRMIYNALAAYMKRLGKVIAENNSAIYVNVGGNKNAFARMTKEDVVFEIGPGVPSVKTIDIGRFKDAKEELKEDVLYNEIDGNDIECDTVCAESID